VTDRGRRRLRLSLRWRVAAAFGLGSLLLTSVLAVAAWNLVSGYMLQQRQDSAVRQARVNVRLVDQALRTRSEGLDELLTGLTTGPDSSILLHEPGRWVTSGRQVDPHSLPAAFLTLAKQGTAIEQRLRVEGVPVLAVALPVDRTGDSYIELVPLLQLDETFRFLSALLVAGVLAGGVLGGALGVWTSQRALRPLHGLTAAAARIASGDLGARLPPQSDRDLAQLENTFNATADALEQRVRRDARFAGDVSHELRSPLTTLLNVAEVLQRHEHEMPATSREAVRLLTSVLQGFQRMVVDLLEISRTDLDADALEPEQVDLAELVHDVLAVARLDRPVTVTAQPDPVTVEADRRTVERIMANLVDNADRHAGGPVRIGITRHGGDVRVEVDDAGPGVPVELRERVFERFARGVLSGRRGSSTGSGLGLALVAQHVARHGGRVWVEDRPGGGARFVVCLPAQVRP
jgi:signal transduction histidine kinase